MFALYVKKSVLPLYEQVFDIEYPLPKLDTLVATDFDAGAMENWVSTPLPSHPPLLCFNQLEEHC